MQSTIHFLWCFVLVAFVTIAPSIATQENRTNQRKRHVRHDFDPSTLRQLAHSLHSGIAAHARNFFQFYVALDRENHGKVLLSKAQQFTVDVVSSCASYGEVLRTGFWEYVGKRVLIHMYIPPFSTWWFHLVSCTKTT